MSIAEERQQYFWLSANDPVTATEPEPATFQDSKITPLIDMAEYRQKLIEALAEVGTSPDASDNRGDFIYIANWWLGLLGGSITPPESGFNSTGWTVEDTAPFNLDPTNLANDQLNEILKEKSRRGVDVRALGWISYSVMTDRPHPLLWVFPPLQSAVANSLQRNNLASIAAVNAQTLNAIKNLRSEPTLAKSAVLNILAHSAGAVHVKGAVIGTKPGGSDETRAIAFTGGLDFVQDRWAAFGHEPDPTWTATPSTPFWHDIQAAIEGPAAQAFYDHFRQMWNEIIARDVQKFRFEGDKLPSFVTGTPRIEARNITGSPLPVAGATHHVQSLRTIPAFNYHWYNCLPEGQAASFAPNGLFEVRAAWKKAIENAHRYIYVEDQLYYSREIMSWINGAIRDRPNLRVIIMMQGAGDPNDAPDNTKDIHNEVFNIGLLGQGSNPAPSVALTATQQNQIRIYKIWGESELTSDTTTVDTVDTSPADAIHITLEDIVNTNSEPLPANAVSNVFHFVATPAQGWRILGNLPTPVGEQIALVLEKVLPAPTVGETVRLGQSYGILTHSKITIIDDVWAMIGSANFMRRSLYTDWEHSVAFIDDGGGGVKEFRKRVWAEHFNADNTPAGVAPFDNLDEAIGGWDPDDPAWKTTVDSPTLPTRTPPDRGPDYIQRVPLPFPTVDLSEDRRAEFDGYRDPDSRQDWGGLCKP